MVFFYIYMAYLLSNSTFNRPCSCKFDNNFTFTLDLNVKKKFKIQNCIGIGGVSRAGKSSLAKAIALHCNQAKVLILDQDDYILPTTHLPRIRNHIDWEHPSTLDVNKLLAVVNKAMTSADIVIVEGIFAFYFPELNNLFTHRIFINLPEKIFFERKKQDLRWGKEPVWYIRHIWTSFQLWGQPNKEVPGLVLNGHRPVDLKVVFDFLGVQSWT